MESGRRGSSRTAAVCTRFSDYTHSRRNFFVPSSAPSLCLSLSSHPFLLPPFARNRKPGKSLFCCGDIQSRPSLPHPSLSFLLSDLLFLRAASKPSKVPSSLLADPHGVPILMTYLNINTMSQERRILAYFFCIKQCTF